MSRSPHKLRAWAEINLSGLERNLKTIRHHLPDHLKFISVVKANAYGHGLEPTVTRLMRSEADLFAVANLEEAMRIKGVGAGWPTLILSPLLASEVEEAVAHEVTPVISSIEECQRLQAAAVAQKKRTAIHLKVDSGMGRIGVWYEEALPLIDQLSSFSHLELKGICTHFAASDSDLAFTKLQRNRFTALLQSRSDWPEGLIVHADNSAGTENFQLDSGFNATRIGLLQFGIKSHSESLFKEAAFEPILAFRCRVGLTKTLPAGTSISYGHTHTLNKSTTIGILTAGYADGIPLALSNRGVVLINGIRCPILGRVTMDQTVVDLSDVPQTQVGDIATIIGNDGPAAISAEEVALTASSIPWQILCGISDRVARIYKRDSAL